MHHPQNTSPPHINQTGHLTFNYANLPPTQRSQLIALYDICHFESGEQGLEYVFVDDLKYVTMDQSRQVRLEFYEKSRFKYMRKGNRWEKVSCQCVVSPHTLRKLGLIAHIGFPQLLMLMVNGICVTSIEALSYINAPQLTSLYLQQNRITLIKPLQKTLFIKNLQKLHLDNNRFHSIKPLNRGHFPRLKYFSLERISQEEFIWAVNEENDHVILVEDLRDLVKMQTISCNIIIQGEGEKIISQKLMKNLRSIVSIE